METISSLRRQIEALKRKYAREIAAAVLKSVAQKNRQPLGHRHRQKTTQAQPPALRPEGSQGRLPPENL